MNCQSLAGVSAQILRELDLRLVNSCPPPWENCFAAKKLLGGRLSQPNAMDESQLETQLRDTKASNRALYHLMMCCYIWVGQARRCHDIPYWSILGWWTSMCTNYFCLKTQVSRVLIHSGPFRPERHQTIVASNFADYWFWMIKSAWNQALPCWIIHDHPTSQIPRPKSWRGEPVPIEQWMAGLGCTHGATHSGDFRGCKTS